MSFRVEYKRPGNTAMFQRNVRFHVSITPAGPTGNGHSGVSDKVTSNGKDHSDSIDNGPKIYAITFTLISGIFIQIIS